MRDTSLIQSHDSIVWNLHDVLYPQWHVVKTDHDKLVCFSFILGGDFNVKQMEEVCYETMVFFTYIQTESPSILLKFNENLYVICRSNMAAPVHVSMATREWLYPDIQDTYYDSLGVGRCRRGNTRWVTIATSCY